MMVIPSSRLISARASMTMPAVLLADEPISSLDPVSAQSLADEGIRLFLVHQGRQRAESRRLHEAGVRLVRREKGLDRGTQILTARAGGVEVGRPRERIAIHGILEDPLHLGPVLPVRGARAAR